MNCDEITDRMTAHLKGLLDDRAESDLHLHLAACDDCRLEADAIEQLWVELGQLDEPVPSDRMRSRFYAALGAYEQANAGGLAGRLQRAFERLWPQQPLVQLMLTAGALLIGLLAGGAWLAPARSPEIEQLRAQMQSMERSISLTLLEHGSASDRLRGVEFGERAEPDERVVDALLSTVTDDPNESVRLAAIEALAPLVDRPQVGGRLVDSLERQRSPMLQVTLGELLLDAGVEGSRNAVERLIERDETDPAVRDHLRDVMRSSS